MLRQALRYLARLTLLTMLFGLVWQQVWVYRSEPLRTASSRRRAPFPRLTICPDKSAPTVYLLPSLARLVNGSISGTEFYETVTTRLRGEAGAVFYRGRSTYFSDEHGPGLWREKYYIRRRIDELYMGYTRCVTFFPGESLNVQGSGDHHIEVSLVEAALFKVPSGPSYRLYVHGDDVPNVGDLPEWAPFTESVPLHSGRHGTFTITARRTERVSVRRRPCSSRPGYSVSQCLKECQWRRLTELAGCRLPHMVGAAVYLPEIDGFMEHLPLCSRLPTDERFRFALGPRKPMCIRKSLLFNISTLFQEHHRYAPKPSPMKEHQQKRTLNRLNRWGTSEADDGNRSTSPPPPSTPPRRPRSARAVPPPPPPLPEWRPFLDAFVNLPNDVSSINSTSCQCPLACEEITYTLTERINYDKGLDWNPCVAFFSLTFDFTEEIVRETTAISLGDLLASIGGFMGLFTGVSLYTIAEYIEGSVVSIYEGMKTWKKGKDCRKTASKRRVSTLSIEDLENGN